MEIRHDIENLEPGTVLEGRYELLEELGKGGFGIVYRARQLATTQTVAIKVLDVQTWDAHPAEKRLARFRREMQLCGQLHHPNIVRLIDFGQTVSGFPYAVFDFAPGKNLSEVLAEEGALAPRETRHLMLQVLDALACAHAQGVVHRDLKPSNIMVIPTGARRNALVLDFGIGAFIDGTYARITATNEVLGTPSYAAPEQLRAFPPTPRSDLFAWGLVFIECLTGRQVLSGDSLLAAIAQQLGPEPIPIPAPIRAEPIGAILRRVLEKDVHARDVAASALFREIEECVLEPSAPWRSRVEPIRIGADQPTVSMAGLSQDCLPSTTALCYALSAKSATRDLGELDALLRRGLQRCAELSCVHGGHLSAVIGDMALFLFGHPASAARAALAVATAASSQGDEPLAALTARMGIESGPVTTDPLAAERSGTRPVTGTTPWLAARLATAALSGHIAVGPSAQKLLRDTFTLKAAGLLQLQGLTDTVEAFELDAPDSTAGPQQEQSSAARMADSALL
ncbi:protein kinase [Sorangium sp. So ce367]|uniref:protein kinase domain-containing protein n=1 Tax=Sorangium sp. So ce367 TaxID=3133305 RepID=UPI003F5D8470